SNRAAYLSIANFALLIPLSIRSLRWIPYDKAVSWHRVFAVLAFVNAAQHGCYRLSERLISLEPIMESSRHLTGIASLSIIGIMLLTAHEVIRANQYSWFRTLHLMLFLSLIISASLHNSSFLILNFIGIAAWLGSRVARKIQASPKIVSILFTTALMKAASQQDLESKLPSQFHMELDGPYGTPWLSVSKHYYTDFELAVFICSGIGVTPWIAVMQHIASNLRRSRTRDVHLIWSIHDAEMYDAFNPNIFSLLKQSSVMFHVHVYITGNHSTLPSAFNDDIIFHSGRPNVSQYMTELKDKNPDIDAGVGVCAYDQLERTVDRLVHSSKFSDQKARWWLKKESFRI
ncbi:hypothetical protein BGW37DRAFT_551978, partial [Umbelopsis sp. PMI_123]